MQTPLKAIETSKMIIVKKNKLIMVTNIQISQY